MASTSTMGSCATRSTAPYKWLDFQRFFERMRPDDEIEAVKYFTAYWANDEGNRHRIYTGALAAHSPKVQVIEGNFKRHQRLCKSTKCTFAGFRGFHTYEEKHTDVNIALHMLDDAYQDACDAMVLVTADSDLVPAVALVRQRRPNVKIIVYIPGPHTRYLGATEIRSVADRAKSIPANLLRSCQLPETVSVGAASFSKPKSW